MGMTGVEAYDGTSAGGSCHSRGRKDPEMLGEDDFRGLQDEADFYGHLVDYKEKGNTIEYLGHDTVDGDDAYRLKVTLKNGDIVYYYLDPETFLEIRTETTQFIHGSVRESFSEMGSFKLVNGVYFPFAMESGNPRSPGETSKITIDKIEANVPMDASEFKMPARPNRRVSAVEEGVLVMHKRIWFLMALVSPALVAQAPVRYDSGTISGPAARATSAPRR